MTACRITVCDAEATTLVTVDRADSPAVRASYAWHGHHEAEYCFAHAIQRPSAEGITEYGDVWTLKPLTPAGA